MIDWISLSRLVKGRSPESSLASELELDVATARCADAGGLDGTLALLGDGQQVWHYWDGDLAIDGHVDVNVPLIVGGDLTVKGTYLDTRGGWVSVVVLGDLVAENVLNGYHLGVAGSVRVADLFYACEPQHTTEIAGGLEARAFLNDQKELRCDLAKVRVSCFASVGGGLRGDNTLRVFAPELMARAMTSWGPHDYYAPESDVIVPIYDDVCARIEAGSPLFREVLAGEELPAFASEVIALKTDFLADNEDVDPLLWALLEDR